jgi:hypothetical protein
LIEYQIPLRHCRRKRNEGTKISSELSKISSVDGYLSRGHIDEYYRRYEAERQIKKAFSVAYSKVSCQKLANLYKNKMNEPERAKIIWDEFKRK